MRRSSRPFSGEDSADSLAVYVEAIGHSARVANDGPEALKVAAAFSPEVALVNIGLPLMNGYELARRIREHDGLQQVRLVAVTGYGQPADRQQLEARGIRCPPVKPVDLSRLQQILDG